MPYKFNPFTGTLDEVGTGGGGGATNLDGLTDVTIAAPSDWEVLGYNATSGLWENTSHIHASVAGNLYVHIKNTDSVQLDKGTPFYITGTVGASDQVEVQAADNTDPTKGPAIGLVEDNLPINAEGNGVLIGEIYNYDTATPGWSTNDALYVSAAGAITNAQPASGYRQIVGYVGRVHASTGTIVVLGNQKDPVAGSDTEIQFNDNGGFGASADLTWDDTNKELGVGGDINLDDGGTFSTTVQSVTPTANRTISFPDATGTVALVSGASGTIQYNDAGTNAGDSGLLYDDISGSLTVGGKTVTVDAPVINLSQTWNNSGTTFTGLKLNVTNTASANDSSLLDLQAGGSSKFKVNNNGSLNIYSVGTNTPTSFGIGSPATSLLATYTGARWNAAISGDRLVLENTSWLGFSSLPGTDANFPLGGNVDTRLYRDSANILAQRNGTAAQTFRLYNTLTGADVSATGNYERARLQWSGNELRFGTEVGTGGGTLRSLGIYQGATRYQIIGSSYNQFDKDIYMSNANIVTDTSTGFKIGTATTQKLGFYNATPVVQPTTAVGSATVAGGGGTAVDDATTFNGYTLAQVVQALQNLGILA